MASAVCLDEIGIDCSNSETDSNDEFQPPASLAKFKVITPTPSPSTKEKNDQQIRTTPCQIFNQHVTGALDWNKTSDCEAVRLMIPFAAALGCDPSTLPLSRSTIQRFHKKARKEHTESTKAEFAPDFPLVVHWDGKILPEISGLGEVDQLPVLVSGDGMDKLLGVPKVASEQESRNPKLSLIFWSPGI